MPRPAWQETFSVNVRVLDTQHKRLFDLMGNLYDGVGKGYDATFLGIRIMELSIYAGTHFDMEELMMSEYHFPGYAEHVKEHEVFKERIMSLEQDLATGRAPFSLDKVSFLTVWYEHHILNFDQKYSSFLNGKGIY